VDAAIRRQPARPRVMSSMSHCRRGSKQHSQHPADCTAGRVSYMHSGAQDQGTYFETSVPTETT
jgi:hypothetical protein